jgi:hypothetical protein
LTTSMAVWAQGHGREPLTLLDLMALAWA